MCAFCIIGLVILKKKFIIQMIQLGIESIYTLFISIQSKFGFHFINLFFLFVRVNFLESLCWLIIKHHKVAIANIETGKMVTCIFSIKNIFIDHKSCSSCFWSVSPNLKKNIIILVWGNIVPYTYTLIWRIAPYLPKISYISSEVILYGRFRT